MPLLLLALCAALLGACGIPVLPDPVGAHLNTGQAALSTTATAPPAEISAPAASPSPASPSLPPPAPPLSEPETYNVTVHNVPVRDLLFVLARDAKLNVDIHPDVSGEVSLNAVARTLPQLLARIARQAKVRFEREDDTLLVLPDTPFLRHYKVDYVNLSRHMSGAVATSTQIATSANTAGGAESVLGAGNLSSTRVENVSKNLFWESLEKDIQDLLRETLETPPNAAPAVIVHPESGVVTVRATERQHERVREFIERVENAARRQVMIEATIVEVELSDGYQQGIEWSRVWSEGDKALSLTPPALVGNLPDANMPFVLNFAHHANPLTLTLKLLQSFGTTRVLSSPRLSVLNNQTALLKVVENVVYFNIKADVTPGNANSNAIVAYTTTPQTVSVGLVMTVTPQIGVNDSVILNVRPTISSISGMVKDPNPDIPQHLSNEIPQIRTREIESILRVASGEIAVLGGLMEDHTDYKTGRMPLLGQLPVFGEMFTSRHNAARKSELVIFLRPIILHDPGLNGDFAPLRKYLPDEDFFAPPPVAQPLSPDFPVWRGS
ncbi:MAG: hypothetical protein LBS89_04625 [Zoogloeaceae bacterium]|nr:hypothetical protein [Zoogloeaceae bacterium]